MCHKSLGFLFMVPLGMRSAENRCLAVSTPELEDVLSPDIRSVVPAGWSPVERSEGSPPEVSLGGCAGIARTAGFNTSFCSTQKNIFVVVLVYTLYFYVNCVNKNDASYNSKKIENHYNSKINLPLSSCLKSQQL